MDFFFVGEACFDQAVGGSKRTRESGKGQIGGNNGNRLELRSKLNERLNATQQCRIEVLTLDSIFLTSADQLGAECFIECGNKHLLQLRYFILRCIQNGHVIGICRDKNQNKLKINKALLPITLLTHAAFVDGIAILLGIDDRIAEIEIQM